MTEYNKENPELDFINRTLEIISQYKQYVLPKLPNPEKSHEVTLLTNCLLGLLVLPKERKLCSKIPKISIKELSRDWGLQAKHIRNAGKKPKYCQTCKVGILEYKDRKDELDLRQFIKEMRHCVAHMGLKAHSEGGQIKNLEFSNKSGFKAEIPVDCLETFVTELARSLLNNLIKG